MGPVAPFIGPAIGAIGGASGGKKAGKGARRQADIQQQVLALGERQLDLGEETIAPSIEFYNRLLQGGQPARLAVEPALASTDVAFEAQRRQIEETLPRGGERNLAIAQSRIGQAGTRSQAYIGAQREAAGALGQLAGLPFGVAPGLIGAGTSLAGPITQFGLQQQQNVLGSAAGIGQAIYSASQKKQEGGFTPSTGAGAGG